MARDTPVWFVVHHGAGAVVTVVPRGANGAAPLSLLILVVTRTTWNRRWAAGRTHMTLQTVMLLIVGSTTRTVVSLLTKILGHRETTTATEPTLSAALAVCLVPANKYTELAFSRIECIQVLYRKLLQPQCYHSIHSFIHSFIHYFAKRVQFI